MDRQTLQTEVKKALSETVLLSDGRYGYIISEVHTQGQDRWECHVCSRIINTERAMLMHLSHPLHMNKLRAPHHPPENFRKKTSKNEERTHSDGNKNRKEEKPWVATDTIDPGEPIPPGMEDVVKKVCQIQETLDNHPGPLIGIEYIVELISSEDGSEPKYICLLCEKKGDPRSVMVHLSSHNHALRYISCFFRTAGNFLNMIPKLRENRKGVAVAVQKIAEEIEKTFGRLKPITASAENFAQQKYEILRSIEEKDHFRETPGTTFLEFCSMDKIKEYSRLAEAEIAKPPIRSFDENNMNQSNEKLENNSLEKKPVQSRGISPGNKSLDSKQIEARHPVAKLSFSIGKPERSFGRNQDIKAEEKKDDDVIIVGTSNDPIEIHSMSSISSASDDDGMKNTSKYRGRSRSRSLTRGARDGRGRSPIRRRSPVRRRTPAVYRDSRYRSRSRSRSRSRGRDYRDRDRLHRVYRREADKSYPRDWRSRSKEREKNRYESRRYRRSISLERDRRRSPYKSRRSRSPNRSPSYKSKYQDKSPEPKKKKISEYQQKMDAYRAKLHDLEVEMDKKLKFYRERPEKHPQYSNEWKTFWNKRYKELQLSGKDPNGYDFKPEWIVFWDERVKHLHEEELAIKKEDLKEMLPKEEKGPSSDLQDISPPTPEGARDVTVDDIKNTWKALTGSDIKAPPKAHSPTPEMKSPRRSPSPWDGGRDDTRKSRKGVTFVADPPIVHCLRMLSVIEQQLGSLGPKALDLLSKAILMEKVKPNESMVLLQDPDIHIFFETVKEKIRGQLIAGIVVRYLVNSCRSLISTIESMLAANPLKPKPIPQPKTYTPIRAEPVKVAGVGLVNKMAVAQQIAEVLVSQGRTDVSQMELEELINAVVGIASSSNANVNQSPAAFISQLNIQNSTATPQINELLSNLISSAQKSISGPLTPASIEEKQVEEIKCVPEPVPAVIVSLPQIPPSSLAMKNSSKAFSEAMSAAKATVSELSLTTSTPAIPPVKDKPLFPINTIKATNPPIKEPIKESPVEKVVEEEVPKNQSVSDDDLKERLLKFKTLSREEQQTLIALLKELEGKEPERVEKLRKYVTVGLTQTTSAPPKTENENSRLSPFSSRAAGGTNPAPEERNRPRLMDSDNDEDDDDDDYSVEDVYKSVSEKLKKKEGERNPDKRLNSSELFDENTGSSHFSNPAPPMTPLNKNKSVNSDPRIPLSSAQQSQGIYTVSDSSQQKPYQISHTPSFPSPPAKAGWPKGMYQVANSYPPPNNPDRTTYPQSQYEPSQYYQNESEQGRFYSNQGGLPTGGSYSTQGSTTQQYPIQGGLPSDSQYPMQGGLPSDNQYPPYTNQQQQQSYPNSQMPYSNAPVQPPSFSYRRPGIGYYANYRQY